MKIVIKRKITSKCYFQQMIHFSLFATSNDSLYSSFIVFMSHIMIVTIKFNNSFCKITHLLEINDFFKLATTIIVCLTFVSL